MVCYYCVLVGRGQEPPTNAFAALVWLAALSALAAAMVGCFSFFASQKLERCRHFMAGIGRFSGFWLLVALLTPTKQRDLGKDGSPWRPSPSSPRSCAAARPRRDAARGARGAHYRRVLPRAADAAGAAPCPPWCVCPDVRAWWASRQSVVTAPPEKAVDDAPRLLYPIPGAAEARVVPVDPAADELPPPPLTVYPLSP